MKKFRPSNTLLGILLALALPHIESNAEIVFETSYSIEQTGNTNFVANDSIPGNLNVSPASPIATYALDLKAAPDDPFNLKASVGLDMEIDQRDAAVTWNEVHVTANAKSGIEDQVFVDGVAGASAGQIEFLWAVTGLSEISFEGDGIIVNDTLKTSAVLTSSVPADTPDIFLHDESGAIGDVDSTLPSFSGFESFFVDWTPGTAFPIEFELNVSAELKITNFDAAGFEADLNADFGNTAVLQQINIFDGNGTRLNSASLISSRDGFNYTNAISVPEPSSSVFLISSLCVLGISRYSRRQQMVIRPE